MRKVLALTVIVLLAMTTQAFAEPKKAELGNVGSCMRECVQTINPSDNDHYATDISLDEFTSDCVNYCNPNLKEGYCSPEVDDCCNVMYQEMDGDCVPTIALGDVCDPTLINSGEQRCQGSELGEVGCFITGDAYSPERSHRCQQVKLAGEACYDLNACETGFVCNILYHHGDPIGEGWTGKGICVDQSIGTGMHTFCTRGEKDYCSKRLVLTCKYNIFYDRYL